MPDPGGHWTDVDSRLVWVELPGAEIQHIRIRAVFLIPPLDGVPDPRLGKMPERSAVRDRHFQAKQGQRGDRHFLKQSRGELRSMAIVVPQHLGAEGRTDARVVEKATLRQDIEHPEVIRAQAIAGQAKTEHSATDHFLHLVAALGCMLSELCGTEYGRRSSVVPAACYLMTSVHHLAHKLGR